MYNVTKQKYMSIFHLGVGKTNSKKLKSMRGKLNEFLKCMKFKYF